MSSIGSQVHHATWTRLPRPPHPLPPAQWILSIPLTLGGFCVHNCMQVCVGMLQFTINSRVEKEPLSRFSLLPPYLLRRPTWGSFVLPVILGGGAPKTSLLFSACLASGRRFQNVSRRVISLRCFLIKFSLRLVSCNKQAAAWFNLHGYNEQLFSLFFPNYALPLVFINNIPPDLPFLGWTHSSRSFLPSTLLVFAGWQKLVILPVEAHPASL